MTFDENQQGAEVTGEELEAALKLPTVFVNRIITQNHSIGMRISFGEYASGAYSPEFRFSMVMAYDDLLAFRDLLTHQLMLAGYPAEKAGNSETKPT